MFPDRFAFLNKIILRRPLLLACFSGLIAVVFALGYLNEREKSILKISEPVHVVVAARNLLAGELIDEGAVKKENVSQKFVQPAAFLDVSDVLGRVAAVQISANTHITSSNSKNLKEFKKLAAVIPDGKRAVSLVLNDALLISGLIKPNDAVDVIATFDLGSDAFVKRITKTILENIRVLAVDSNLTGLEFEPKKQSSKSGVLGSLQSPAPSYSQKTITFALTPMEAQALTFAKETGAISVAVRAFGDDTLSEHMQPSTIASVTGGREELIPTKRNFREYKGKNY